jgi:hypothetical protein
MKLSQTALRTADYSSARSRVSSGHPRGTSANQAPRAPSGLRRRRRARLSITLAVALLFPLGAQAGDNELQLTLGPGYATLPDVGEGLDGVGGGVEVAYRITSLWTIAAGGFFGHHFGDTIPPETEEDEPQVFEATDVTSIWLGPMVSLDYFVVVPWFGLAPELILTRGELQTDQSEVDLGLRWTLGFDYRPSRNWSVGFEANYHSFLRQPFDYPVFITTMFRVSWYHGFDVL